MTTFACKTRDNAGVVVQKTIEADSQREIAALLRKDGLFPIQIKKIRAGSSSSDKTGGRRPGKRIKPRQVLDFTSRLAASLGAGVPILSSVALMRDQCSNPAFKEVLTAIFTDIEGGQPLSAALASHPRAFDEIFVNSVEAGEASGSLDAILETLAEFTEADMAVRNDVRSALMYPAILISTLGMAITVLMIFVVPRFTVLYSDMGSDLPLPTQILVAFSSAVTDYFWPMACALGALGYGLLRYVRTPKGRLKADSLLLHVPIIGGLIDTAITLRAVQMLGLFCHVGMPILEGLGLIARTTRNSKIRGKLEDLADAVACGETLSSAMEEVECFDPSVRQMIQTGEVTGSLETSCRTVTVQLRKDLSYLTRNLSTFIEPLMTLGLAVIVLFVALATFLPMWDMASAMK